MDSLMKAVSDYLELAKVLLNRLQKVTGHSNVMHAWRSGKIERSGYICDVSYEFHGSGVYIEAKEGDVEIDFLPGGQFGGFDSWRLWQFIKKSPHGYIGLSDEEAVRLALIEALAKGAVVKVANTNLYRLVD